MDDEDKHAYRVHFGEPSDVSSLSDSGNSDSSEDQFKPPPINYPPERIVTVFGPVSLEIGDIENLSSKNSTNSLDVASKINYENILTGKKQVKNYINYSHVKSKKRYNNNKCGKKRSGRRKKERYGSILPTVISSKKPLSASYDIPNPLANQPLLGSIALSNCDSKNGNSTVDRVDTTSLDLATAEDFNMLPKYFGKRKYSRHSYIQTNADIITVSKVPHFGRSVSFVNQKNNETKIMLALLKRLFKNKKWTIISLKDFPKKNLLLAEENSTYKSIGVHIEESNTNAKEMMMLDLDHSEIQNCAEGVFEFSTEKNDVDMVNEFFIEINQRRIFHDVQDDNHRKVGIAEKSNKQISEEDNLLGETSKFQNINDISESTGETSFQNGLIVPSYDHQIQAAPTFKLLDSNNDVSVSGMKENKHLDSITFHNNVSNIVEEGNACGVEELFEVTAEDKNFIDIKTKVGRNMKKSKKIFYPTDILSDKLKRHISVFSQNFNTLGNRGSLSSPDFKILADTSESEINKKGNDTLDKMKNHSGTSYKQKNSKDSIILARLKFPSNVETFTNIELRELKKVLKKNNRDLLMEENPTLCTAEKETRLKKKKFSANIDKFSARKRQKHKNLKNTLTVNEMISVISGKGHSFGGVDISEEIGENTSTDSSVSTRQTSLAHKRKRGKKKKKSGPSTFSNTSENVQPNEDIFDHTGRFIWWRDQCNRYVEIENDTLKLENSWASIVGRKKPKKTFLNNKIPENKKPTLIVVNDFPRKEKVDGQRNNTLSHVPFVEDLEPAEPKGKNKKTKKQRHNKKPKSTRLEILNPYTKTILTYSEILKLRQNKNFSLKKIVYREFQPDVNRLRQKTPSNETLILEVKKSSNEKYRLPKENTQQVGAVADRYNGRRPRSKSKESSKFIKSLHTDISERNSLESGSKDSKEISSLGIGLPENLQTPAPFENEQNTPNTDNEYQLAKLSVEYNDDKSKIYDTSTEKVLNDWNEIYSDVEETTQKCACVEAEKITQNIDGALSILETCRIWYNAKINKELNCKERGTEKITNQVHDEKVSGDTKTDRGKINLNRTSCDTGVVEPQENVLANFLDYLNHSSTSYVTFGSDFDENYIYKDNALSCVLS